jgi:hypothetical protein
MVYDDARHRAPSRPRNCSRPRGALMARWYVQRPGAAPIGPVDAADLRGAWSRHEIPPNTMVCAEGFSEWAPFHTVGELVGLAHAATAAAAHGVLPVEAPGSATAPVPTGRVRPRAGGSRLWPWLVVVGALVLLAGGAVLFALPHLYSRPTKLCKEIAAHLGEASTNDCQSMKGSGNALNGGISYAEFGRDPVPGTTLGGRRWRKGTLQGRGVQPRAAERPGVIL